MLPHFPWIVGHIVGERPPNLFSWLIALLFGLGVVVAFTTRGVTRKLFLLVAIVGLAGIVWDMYERGARPRRPDLTIRLVLPRASTTMPVPIEVCGENRAGKATRPTAGGRLLLVRIDGVQAAEAHTSNLILPVAQGRHTLSVEVNSAYHQEFVPPLEITKIIDVRNQGGTIRFPSCGSP